MKSNYLFSHKCKPIGWFLFIVFFILGLVFTINEDLVPDLTITVYNLTGGDDVDFSGRLLNKSKWIKNDIIDELFMILIIVGGILVAFSKTKDEDEYISKIRMESLIWATYVNYGVLLFTILFIYGGDFFNVMIYNMFTILLFFILRFHYVLYKLKRGVNNEE